MTLRRPLSILAALPNHHGSGYHRGLVPLRALAARGHRINVAVGLDSPDVLAGVDVLMLPLAQNESVYELARAFQSRGGRVVYEFDDDYRATPHSNPAWRFPGFSERIDWMNRILAMADAAIAATPVLANAYRDLNPNIFVARNTLDPIDTAAFFGQREPEADGEVRIGWGGSASHGADMASIVEPLVQVLDAHANVRFVMAGADMRPLFPERLRGRLTFVGHTFYHNDDGSVREFCYPGETWPVVRYYQALAAARLHVAVAPLIDDPFNRAKSNLKLLEYAALGIPAVASAVGPYREYRSATDLDAPVLLAGRPQEWVDALTTLVESPEGRDRLRQANRRKLLREHLVFHAVDAWEQAFEATL